MRHKPILNYNATQITNGSDQTWKIQCVANDQQVEIWLHGIVGDEISGTDSQSVGKMLSQHRGKPVTMYVNSPGGLAYDGVAIYNALASHKGPTTGIIEGLAGSAASLALMGCDTIKAHENGKFHPHYSLCVAIGHKDEIKDTLLMMEKLDEDLERIYANRSKQSIEVVKQHLQGPHGDGTHFTAKEAKEVGYIDEIIEPSKKPAAKPRNATADRIRALVRFNQSRKYG
jgi:ATP-dependent protease ClpP protease subunit